MEVRSRSALLVASFLLVTSAVLAFAASASPPGPTPNASFAKNVRVNTGGTPYAWQVEPTMAVGDNGVVYVGWKEANSATGGGQRVSFSFSMDAGNTWAPNVLMATANPGAQASDPWLSKDQQGRIHFTRLEYTSTISGVTTSNTTDGTSWGSTNYLDDMGNFADKETVASDSNGVLYLAYDSDTAMNNLALRKSYDGGRTWTPRVYPPDVNGFEIGAYVAVDHAGRVLVAWSDFRTGNILIDSSTDGGATWGADVRVNDIPGSIRDPLNGAWNMSMPSVVIDQSDNVYVSWTDYRAPDSFGDIYVARSRDHGASWDPGVRVNDYVGPAGQRMADITVDSRGVIHAAWYDMRSGNFDVYYSSSSDGGQTWSPNLRVTTATTPRSYTRPGDYITIRTDPIDDNVYVVWTDGRGSDFDIYFAALRDTSVTQRIMTSPSGLQVLIDGVTFSSPQVRHWGLGEMHSIGTVENQSVAPGTRNAFDRWSDMMPIVHGVTVMGSDNYTAYFHLQHFLNVTSPYGTTTGGGWHDFGTTATACVNPLLVQPAPDTRHLFTGWGLDATGTANCSGPILMDLPKEARAEWLDRYLVTAVTPYGNISGAGWYDSGQAVNLTLDVPLFQVGVGERARFVSWSGDASGTSLVSYGILVDSPKHAIALWRTEYLLSVVSAHGNPQGGGWYASGTPATIHIEALVSPGGGARFVFAGWVGAITSGQTTATLTVNAPATVTAVWATQYNVTVISDRGNVTGTGWYDSGSIANITAPPTVHDANGTWLFDRWSGDFNSSDASAGVFVNGSKIIHAGWARATESGPATLGFLLWTVPVAIAVAVALVVLLIAWRRRKEKNGSKEPEPASVK